MNELIRNGIQEKFLNLFNEKPLIVRSPGRVNIIGEHTDYNDGFVLPAAINKAIYLAITARTDEQVHLYSSEFNASFQTTLSQMRPAKEVWPNYILGVADQLVKRGYVIRGFNLVIDGDIPIGSGLSSSAAVECATAFALNALFDLNITKLDLALIAQKAEHEFAGVLCGIMDQFASVFGKKDQVIRLDCRSLEYEYVPLKLEGYQLLLLNTNVKHSLASSEYNTRRNQCERGVALVKKHHPEVESLRDVTMDMLLRYVKDSDELIYRRCKYIIEENQRLLEGCEDLINGRIDYLGQKMFQSHEGLRREYEVSCPELDFLVDAVKNHPGVLGARMMGGGFGGCTINIVKENAVDQLVRELSRAYNEKMQKELTPIPAVIEEGTQVLEL